MELTQEEEILISDNVEIISIQSNMKEHKSIPTPMEINFPVLVTKDKALHIEVKPTSSEKLISYSNNKIESNISMIEITLIQSLIILLKWKLTSWIQHASEAILIMRQPTTF